MPSPAPESINIFFSLLRSGLYGRPVPDAEIPDAIDWDAVVAMAQKQTVLGIIIESIRFLPERLRPSGPVMARMNKFALGLIQANLVLEKTVARVAAFFGENGVPGVLLKGQGVARYYREPQMRHSGDIDYYVGRTNYQKAVSLAREKLIAPDTKSDRTDQHFTFHLGQIPVELHRLASRIYTPLRNRRFQRWVTDELEHSSSCRTLALGGGTVALPSVEFDAIFIFYHAWRHFIMGGIGVRHLCDWAMIFQSHGSEIDSDRLAALIRRFGMTAGWKLFAAIVVNHLGVPAERIPLYDPSFSKKSEKILDEILAGGNFGFYSKANLRTGGKITGLRYGLIKLGNYTRYCSSFFTLIPLEATFLFFNRLFFGTLDTARRTLRK